MSETTDLPEPSVPPEEAISREPESPPEIPIDRLDPEALKVLRHLKRNGHQAYLVGGCVRDLLLHVTPKDFDVATSATPDEVRALFRNCRLIGRRFRLAQVYFKGRKIIEVSTFRKNPVDEIATAETTPAPEGDLLISTDNVFGTAEEDARRRDFTVNGLFYDVSLGKVIDYVGGRADLAAHSIHTIGNSEVRLREDPVRLLRAIRFAAKLDFEIAPATWAAMQGSAGELVRCAPARVLEETLRLLRCGASRQAFELLRQVGALGLLLPPVASFLEACGPEEEQRLLGMLDAVDERVRAGIPTEDSLLLATLLLRLARPSSASGAPIMPVEEILADLVHKSRLPRRIAEGARLLLLAQKALHGERRRRGSPTRFLRSPHFADALALMEMSVRVTGEGQEPLRRWQQREGAARAHPGPGESNGETSLDSAPSGESPRRGQRSRRGRRRPGEDRPTHPPPPLPVPEAPTDSDAEDEFPFSGPGLL
jgi:poly(A) polymerase